MKRIAIIGDYNPKEETHTLILRSIEDIQKELNVDLKTQWIGSDEPAISKKNLSEFDGFWFSPGCPYKNTKNVLAAIQYARENRVPALGTCAGFQHMVIEFARNVLGLYGADSVENDQKCADAVIERLACSLMKQKEQLKISDPDTILGRTMGEDEFIGEYRCNFGFNEAYHSAFRDSDVIAATVQNHDGFLRGFELKEHPFFVGTLFIPQLDYKGDGPYRIIRSFIDAVGVHGEREKKIRELTGANMENENKDVLSD
ncbi:MAG: hypothetical protein J5379_01870 [Clostridiales bacterium]|nr:hypothetical protein [Clostridiales bacterium]